MSSLPASIMRRHHFFHYKPMVFFPDVQGHITPQSVVGSGRYSNFFLDYMHVLVTCKFKKD